MTCFTNTAPETGRNDDIDVDVDIDIDIETLNDESDAEIEASDDKIDSEIEASEEPFSPDATWVNTFEKQLTAKLIDGLRNYARPRAYAVARAGRKVDDYYARELVQDAIGDTWSGTLRWDPKRCTLEHHLIRAIQSRAGKHRKHARDNPHDAIGDFTGASQAAEESASSMRADPEDAAQRLYSRETITLIRNLCADDKQVTRVLDAYESGATTKEDVLAFAKMRDRTYHNAHIRLTRIVRALTDHTLTSKRRA